MINFAKGRGLGEKETVIFPGELYKVTPITKKLKPQETIEMRGTLNVSDDNLCHKLFSRIDVSAHDALMMPLNVALERLAIALRIKATHQRVLSKRLC